MRTTFATMTLLVVLACKGSTKEHAQQVENTAKQAANKASSETTRSIKLGAPSGFADAMKAFCNAVPDDGKRYSKDQQRQLIKDTLYNHPNGDLLALWKSIENTDHDTRFQRILEEVDRAQLQSCHLLDLMYDK